MNLADYMDEMFLHRHQETLKKDLNANKYVYSIIMPEKLKIYTYFIKKNQLTKE